MVKVTDLTKVEPMKITTRAAQTGDLPDLCTLINEIIVLGGTTAHQTPFEPARMTRLYLEAPGKIAVTVALAEDEVVGMQSLIWPSSEGHPFPQGWAIIASFVRPDMAGKGVGRALFAATSAAARKAGVTVIDATIRADNTGGLAYYQALGFADYDILPNVLLRDGSRVDRIRKRYDL